MKLQEIVLTSFFLFCFASINLFASLSNHLASFKETVVRGATKTIELHISNSISSPLSYSFSIPVSWVKASPPNGSVEGNATLAVRLILDATKLTEGKYNTAISLNDPHHGGISIPIELDVTTTADIKEVNSVPTEFKLFQNYPNPFNPSTTISFSIPESQKNVSLVVYNVLGKVVSTLVNHSLPQGSYSLNLNAENLPSGIYFYSLETDRFTETKRMILIK